MVTLTLTILLTFPVATTAAVFLGIICIFLGAAPGANGGAGTDNDISTTDADANISTGTGIIGRD